MWLVVGLGNPERRYSGNRHNVGFMIADAIAADVRAPEWREKWKGRTTRASAWGDDLTLLEPLTYMNLSGESVQPAMAFLKVPVAQLVVVHDELDLPFGDVRLKQGGGHAGHNGLRSIIGHVGADFVRVRVGVGRPPPGWRGEVADYVLSDFDASERAELSDVIGRAVGAVRAVVEGGLAKAMKALHTKPAK